MPAYVVSQYQRSEDYDAYRAAATKLNREWGARVLTQSGTEKVVEGEWGHSGMVVIEFPSLDRAREFLESDAYAQVKQLRSGAPPMTIVLLDGAPGV